MTNSFQHSATMQSANNSSSPIFIAGIMTRSGTNFLYNLLCLHPLCRGITLRGVMPEDHLLACSNLLERYTKNVASHWSRHGRHHEKYPDTEQAGLELQNQLRTALGDGLIAFLDHLNPQEGDAPLITKTPNVKNLSYFFKFFPSARLIILIRDGRDVTESNVRSFGADYDFTMHRWVEAAQTIIDFDQEHKNSAYKNQYTIVRYEDLVDDFISTMKQLFDFLEIDAAVYDFEKAQTLPVFGSSENFNKAKHGNSIDRPSGWKVVEKKEGFQPKARWKDWPRRRQSRFRWIASEQMGLLGYKTDSQIEKDGIYFRLRNFLLDQKWCLIANIFVSLKDLEKRIYAISSVRRDFKRLKME